MSCCLFSVVFFFSFCPYPFRRVISSLVKESLTKAEEADLQEKRNILGRRICAWLKDYNAFIPTHTPDSSPPSSHAEKILLRLPSSISTDLCSSMCLFNLPDIERRLRLAQAHDTLSDLRRQLRITSTLWGYKVKQVGPSQRVATRTLTLIERFKRKTTRCAMRYRAARAALASLDLAGDWSKSLLELKDEDIKGPGKGERETEGTRKLSWIWFINREHLNECGSSSAEVLEGAKVVQASDHDLHISQVCVLNGQNPKHEPIVGPRK